MHQEKRDACSRRQKLWKLWTLTPKKRLGPGKPGEIVATTFNKVIFNPIWDGRPLHSGRDPLPLRQNLPPIGKDFGENGSVDQGERSFIIRARQMKCIKTSPNFRYQVVCHTKEHKDEMTFHVELKEEISQPEKLKSEIEQSIRDVMKVRGGVQFVSKGAIWREPKRLRINVPGSEFLTDLFKDARDLGSRIES